MPKLIAYQFRTPGSRTADTARRLKPGLALHSSGQAGEGGERPQPAGLEA
jgi:hypothetical protein